MAGLDGEGKHGSPSRPRGNQPRSAGRRPGDHLVELVPAAEQVGLTNSVDAGEGRRDNPDRGFRRSAGVVSGELIPVLWLCGPPGVGKSTVGWEIFTQLTGAGIEAGYVDIDRRRREPGFTETVIL